MDTPNSNAATFQIHQQSLSQDDFRKAVDSFAKLTGKDLKAQTQDQQLSREEIFQAMDLNGDGKFTWKDFEYMAPFTLQAHLLGDMDAWLQKYSLDLAQEANEGKPLAEAPSEVWKNKYITKLLLQRQIDGRGPIGLKIDDIRPHLSDPEIFFLAIKISPSFIEPLPKEINVTGKFIEEALKANIEVFPYLHAKYPEGCEKLNDNFPDQNKELIKKILSGLSPAMQNNKDFALWTMRKMSWSEEPLLKYFSPKLQKDNDVVDEAACQDVPDAFQYAPELQKDAQTIQHIKYSCPDSKVGEKFLEQDAKKTESDSDIKFSPLVLSLDFYRFKEVGTGQANSSSNPLNDRQFIPSQGSAWELSAAREWGVYERGDIGMMEGTVGGGLFVSRWAPNDWVTGFNYGSGTNAAAISTVSVPEENGLTQAGPLGRLKGALGFNLSGGLTFPLYFLAQAIAEPRLGVVAEFPDNTQAKRAAVVPSGVFKANFGLQIPFTVAKSLVLVSGGLQVFRAEINQFTSYTSSQPGNLFFSIGFVPKNSGF